MCRILPLIFLIFLTSTNCSHRKMARADDKTALTHKIIWDYVDTYNDLYPKLQLPKVKYVRTADNAYFSENKSILYVSTYQQLSRNFKKRLESWAVKIQPEITPEELYEEWYMIMDLSAALSWYLIDHIGSKYYLYRKKVQDIYILSWLFLRENDFYGKKEKEWINIIRHINKNAKSQLSREETMLNFTSAYAMTDRSPAFYTYYSSLGMLKSQQMSKRIKLKDVLNLFENRKKKMEQKEIEQ